MLIFLRNSYVQFMFNLSLLLMFLYLVVQFILTIQRDVQYRVSEYSMGVCLLYIVPAPVDQSNLNSPRPLRNRARDFELRLAMEGEPMRLGSRAGDDHAVREMGDVHEPGSDQGRTVAGERTAHRRGRQCIFRAH